MKIRFELTAHETNTMKNLIVKYAPCDTEIIMKDETIETKIGTMSATNTSEAPVFEVNLKEDFVIDCLKFTDECSQTLMGAVSILKPFCENFTKKLKDSFSKWRDDEREFIAKGIAKNKSGENFLIGLIQREDWVEINPKRKELKKVYAHYPIKELGDISDIENNASAQKAERRYVKCIDGKVSVSDDMVVAIDWAHEMGIDYVPKHLDESAEQQ